LLLLVKYITKSYIINPVNLDFGRGFVPSPLGNSEIPSGQNLIGMFILDSILSIIGYFYFADVCHVIYDAILNMCIKKSCYPSDDAVLFIKVVLNIVKIRFGYYITLQKFVWGSKRSRTV